MDIEIVKDIVVLLRLDEGNKENVTTATTRSENHNLIFVHRIVTLNNAICINNTIPRTAYP